MDIKDYFSVLNKEVVRQYDIAGAARAKGLDPSKEVEALPTKNLAERVEGLVGPKYIADEIKKCQEEKLPREKIIERTIDWILKGAYMKDVDVQGRIEQALRTSLAIQTEGVVSAPLEGISKVSVEKNPDGSNYLSVFFAGPIRGAGGTAAALSVLLADYIRKKAFELCNFRISDYRPTDSEVERYKEELKIYHKRVVRLQYMPTDAEIDLIVRNVPVCIDGDPTEEQEVDINKGLERVKTNRIRGGICLVIGEGIAQKYKQVLKFAEALNSDFAVSWGWLKDMKKGTDLALASSEVKEIRPNKKFLEDIVAGRPIFAYPSKAGGFRLRYGRSNMCGIASKAIHPATMVILEEFPAVGTQFRIERPGKGMVVVPCAEMDGPVIKDSYGNVRRVNSLQEAKEARMDVAEVLYLGDILVPYGDFLKANETLPPSGYVEEWWEHEYKKSGGAVEAHDEYRLGGGQMHITAKQAIEISKKHSIPLHPKYNFPWQDITAKELKLLVAWLSKSDFDYAKNTLRVKNEPLAKRVLELLLVPHTVEGQEVVVDEYALPVLEVLGAMDGHNADFSKTLKRLEDFEDASNAFNAISVLSPIVVRKKVGCYIGARMGRPEKAKERMMEPAPHVLFPVGEAGGNTRSIDKASKGGSILSEVARMRCPDCKKLTFMTRCPECGAQTALEYKCSCGNLSKDIMCKRCKKPMIAYEEGEVPIKMLLDRAEKQVKRSALPGLKGVKGMTSAMKMPESLEKGILRSVAGVFVFKDGTIRYDATDVPTTHFRPKDIGVDIVRLKELGYSADIHGKPLEKDEQIVELFVQDILIPTESIRYITNTCNFIDGLLKEFYGLEPFYKIKSREDLVGQLVVGLAPHTSAAILGRIVGFADVRAILAHPFWHSAKRRNCDGDEDSIMMLMDVLLNFSYAYLPERRGGKMDAPLVINTNLDPKEVDDEAHCMERVFEYPLEFYELTQSLPAAKDVSLDIVKKHLEGNPYTMGLTHFSTWVGAPKESKYVQLGEMSEKTDIELKLCKRIRAVDVNDVAKRLVDSHLIRDTYGNLRAFARQKFRCVKCNAKYRRVPLIGKCEKCGGKVILTVSKGTIEKYVVLTDDVVAHYIESEYIRQRMDLVKQEIKAVFDNSKLKQFSLSDFA